MNAYLSKMNADKSAHHHKFMASVKQYVEEMNSKAHKKRVRNVEAVRNAQKLQIEHSKARSLVGNWRQCVPVDKWSEVYPTTPLPEDPACFGREILDGTPTQVVYVLKPGAREHHYRESTKASHSTTLSDLRATDSSDMATALEQKKQALWAAERAKTEKALKVSTCDPVKLAEEPDSCS